MKKLFSALAMAALASTAVANEKMVGTPGSKIEYPASINESVGDKTVAMKLTGTGLRTKAIFSVYAIASYVAEAVTVKTPAELAAADVPKRLHLVMEREVAGKDMAENIRAGIAANHPGAFAEELKALDEYCSKLTLKKGQHVRLTHTPGVGLMALIGDKDALEISNVKFSVAIWEIYLGKKPLNDRLKKNLVARM
jgi:hypothetical protein